MQCKPRRRKAKRVVKPVEDSVVVINGGGVDEDVEYVTEQVDLGEFSDFQEIFQKFEPLIEEDIVEDAIVEVIAETSEESDMDIDSDDSNAKTEKISNKKAKKLAQMNVYQLKSESARPDLVEWVDATASDPRFLVQLKALRNVVPVPRHWSQKKKYLQNKRGVMKKPFELPAYIRATGIMVTLTTVFVI